MTALLTAPAPHLDAGPRVARSRRDLMCPPTYFDVRYAINPWMDLTRPVDGTLALRQCCTLEIRA